MTVLSTVIAVAVLTAITVAFVLVLRLENPWLQAWALLRAALQLGLLILLLNNIIANPVAVALFLLVMVGAATWIIYRRLQLPVAVLPAIVLIIVISAAIPVTAVFLFSGIEFSARYLLAVGGIVIGNTMTVCTLMGRQLRALFVAQRDEIEGWMSLGATSRRAAQRSVRSAASGALIPSIDQTRTTGIVTLPGAFVGAVFAGASPLFAAQFQLLVLAAVITAGALTVSGMTLFFGAPKTLAIT
ncbi:MAG: ABC transporter permease [Microbacteriaceae bacterium]|nr:ABC transporter permease [Microbacteriaceae bacterium]